MRFWTLLICLIALACGKTSEIAADDQPDGSAGEAGTAGSSGSSGSGGSGGTSGSSGSAGSSGTGGTSGAAGSPGISETHYHACEAPTGALRYWIYKTDPARDLCFLIALGPPTATFPSIQVTPNTLAVESAFVWQGAANCGDFAPPPAVPATGGSGTISWGEYAGVHIDVNVTLSFPQNQTWVPASETFHNPTTITAGFDCQSCNQRANAYKTLIQSSVKPGGGPNGCTSVVRLSPARDVISHTVVCDVYSQTSEAQARATAESALKLAPGAGLLSGPSSDQWVFAGPIATSIPEADRVLAAVSVRTGTLTFGGITAWFGVGDVTAPTGWKPGSELGGGCPASTKPVARGFTGVPNAKKVELDAWDIDAAVDKVWSTALPQGIADAWGSPAFDAVVLQYPKTLSGELDKSEWIVLVNHGWLE